MNAMAPHVSEFLRVRLPRERNASPHTSVTYSHAYMLLFEFASKRLRRAPSALAIEHLDASLIMAFLDHLERDRSNGITTRNARLAAIKSLFKYIEHRVPSAIDQVRGVLAIPMKRSSTRLVGYLTREEAQSLVDAADDSTPLGLRDRAMLHLAISTGIRVSELVALQLHDLVLHPRPTIAVIGKGRRERVLPLWRETVLALKRWLLVRISVTGVENLFVNTRGGAITRSGFAFVLARHAKAAASKYPSLRRKRLSPHILRHTCAMLTLQATRDVRKVALWLGHAHMTTTEVYLRADPTEQLEALSEVAPFELRPGRFKPPDALMAMLNELRSASSESPPLCGAGSPLRRRGNTRRSP